MDGTVRPEPQVGATGSYLRHRNANRAPGAGHRVTLAARFRVDCDGNQFASSGAAPGYVLHAAGCLVHDVAHSLLRPTLRVPVR
ncbi:hypothetical protein J2793_001790 [Paraburkholderia caledonica]|uniref:Uncharacterized protein n=1 Tax=Paraburkholderia caledonica TaxID=134536 RepID=A0AB73I908_9BURK|nr:hypothetical protein [Paraburkholderia caledonica]